MADNTDTPDRRVNTPPLSSGLKRQLNEVQLATFNVLERFGWELKFIRRVRGEPPVVVLRDPDTRKYAVLTAEGELDEHPVLHRFRR